MRDVQLSRQVAEYLDIPPDLLGLAPRHEQETSRRYVDQRLSDTTSVDAQALFGEEGDEPVRRRKLLTGLAGATSSAVLGPTPAAAQSPARPVLSGLEDLLLHRQNSPLLGTDLTPSTVLAAVDASRRDFSACRYDVLARSLPSRIALAQAPAPRGIPGRPRPRSPTSTPSRPGCASSSTRTVSRRSPPTGP
ncbi:hypothetical protein [Streptomyces antimycoticus]|uniref:hypothetical protein n=1 Tax=Streptomyces antimycoticus TaxID=68175 RepID=UPI002570F015|nr:hypothetical protein [Streptomyces antimycoticus]WJD99447.1 hypothetical protein QR300_27585 [Streptomyces antimycoticus]